MSDYEYLIQPERGYSLAEIVDNPQLHNSYIKVIDGERLVDILPMTSRNKYIKNLKPPPEYYLLEEIRTLEGTQAIEKTTPEFSLAPDLNPFHQLIHSIVADTGLTKPENIYKSLINNYRVFPDTRIAHIVIDKIINTMDKNYAYIIHRIIDGTFYYVKGKGPETDVVHLIDYRRGYDPNADQLLDYIESYGERNRDQIDKHMMNIGWITDMETTDMYLDALEKGELWGERICANNKGNITKIRENWYKYQQPMQSWGEKVIAK